MSQIFVAMTEEGRSSVRVEEERVELGGWIVLHGCLSVRQSADPQHA